jgi:hypothetical protein
MTDRRTRDRALVEFVLLPTVFLLVALLGGLRVGAEGGEFQFLAPPLVTLVLSALLLALAARARLIDFGRWLSAGQGALTNVAHALTIAALFFATAQSFNSVLPERGLLRWMFSFFFLWTLWSYQFATFDARRLLRGLAALFATAFLVKHMLLASLYEPGGGWLRRAASVLLEGVTLGTLDAPAHAPATGYISFFTLALYVAGLALLPPAPDASDAPRPADVLIAYRSLPAAERTRLREEIAGEPTGDEHAALSLRSADGAEGEEEDAEEATIVRNKSKTVVGNE